MRKLKSAMTIKTVKSEDVTQYWRNNKMIGYLDDNLRLWAIVDGHRVTVGFDILPHTAIEELRYYEETNQIKLG